MEASLASSPETVCDRRTNWLVHWSFLLRQQLHTVQRVTFCHWGHVWVALFRSDSLFGSDLSVFRVHVSNYKRTNTHVDATTSWNVRCVCTPFTELNTSDLWDEPSLTSEIAADVQWTHRTTPRPAVWKGADGWQLPCRLHLPSVVICLPPPAFLLHKTIQPDGVR